MVELVCALAPHPLAALLLLLLVLLVVLVPVPVRRPAPVRVVDRSPHHGHHFTAAAGAALLLQSSLAPWGGLARVVGGPGDVPLTAGGPDTVSHAAVGPRGGAVTRLPGPVVVVTVTVVVVSPASHVIVDRAGAVGARDPRGATGVGDVVARATGEVAGKSVRA